MEEAHRDTQIKAKEAHSEELCDPASLAKRPWITELHPRLG